MPYLDYKVNEMNCLLFWKTGLVIVIRALNGTM